MTPRLKGRPGTPAAVPVPPAAPAESQLLRPQQGRADSSELGGCCGVTGDDEVKHLGQTWHMASTQQTWLSFHGGLPKHRVLHLKVQR